MYDIYFGFSDDVKNALVSEDREALRKGVSDVQAALDELMGALDFKYHLQDSFIHCTHTARGFFPQCFTHLMFRWWMRPTSLSRLAQFNRNLYRMETALA